EALDKLSARLADHQLDDNDSALRAQMEKLHLSETTRAGAVDDDELKSLFLEYQRAAQAHSRRDERRYLLLGDAIGLDLHRAFEAMIARFAKRGLPTADEPPPAEVREVERLGGAFLSRMVERGYVRPDGSLSGSPLIPEVLFRVRWRMIAHFEPLLGLTAVERRAYHHFVMASTAPADLPRRLAALEKLSQLDESYDTELARAVLLHEAGKDQRAAEVVRKAMADGRQDDRVLSRFARALAK
ncbi:MAG: hypothetical protein JRI55_04170, partial [Deltaproteobacteria bacterium]|nr:hypothetical protein [Deltaproteobacteria bacterium]